MVPGYVLRPFRRTDHDALVSWIRSAEELRHFTGSALRWPLDVDQVRALEDLVLRFPFTLVHEDRPDEPVGHAELVQTDDEVARIARVVIAPEHRGRGLGSTLMRLVLDEARRADYRRVTLNVAAENTAALTTYRRLGFEDRGTLPGSPGVRVMERAID